MTATTAPVKATRRYAMAAPHSGFYYGAVSELRAGGVLPRLIANCQHHHRTRETAERCGERILRDLAR